MRLRFRDHRTRQHGAILSNGNIAVYIFFVLFSVWLAFQVWSRYGGGAPPAGLDPMVMAALGVAVAGKSVERGAQDKAIETRADKAEVRADKAETMATVTAEEVERLKKLALHAHPEEFENGVLKPEPEEAPDG